jgi:NTP pyrophosphatase (non-canonical NTP hydrolase)
MEDILQLIKDERIRQDTKWGPQHHDDGTWLLILIEEVGEASQAVLQGRTQDVVTELVQSAAVIVAWLEYKASVCTKDFERVLASAQVVFIPDLGE